MSIPGKFLLSVLAMFSSITHVFCAATEYPRAILCGDYADPSILRDGEDFYMTHSPFVYTPGFLIWHSRDLVNWEPVCRAMTKVVGSAMAPDLVKQGGKFYIYFPAAGKNWVIYADNIRGPWSDPVQLDVDHIDPGHAVGEDGRRYLFLSDGNRVALSDDGLSVTGKMEKVYSGWDYPVDWKTEGKFLESPKIIHKDDWFYMISAEGGTAGPPTSHMIIAARSKSIDGPWENSPYNPIVHTWGADEPWWSKGHGTLIDDPQGNWWVVYHAYENGAYPMGRQTLIEPIEWLKDGWFRIAKNPPALSAGIQRMDLSDDFSENNLGLQWMTWRDYDPKAITLKAGSLILQTKGTTPKDARLLLTTATDRNYEVQVEVTLAPGTIGGLVLFYSEKAFAGISSDGKQFTFCEDATHSNQYPSRFGNHFFLKIINRQNTCTLLASSDGKNWETIQANIDISGMHHNKYGGFFALRPCMMAAGTGEVKFGHFVYKPL